uniref:Uncharacterized protein n=1 Tax=Arundo donax TaxID=35708 RepID=A0A0A9BPI4_ARUDO
MSGIKAARRSRSSSLRRLFHASSESTSPRLLRS